MLLSFTPLSLSFRTAPSIKESMMTLFQRACMIATRRLEPSYWVVEGTSPFMVGSDIVDLNRVRDKVTR